MAMIILWVWLAGMLVLMLPTTKFIMKNMIDGDTDSHAKVMSIMGMFTVIWAWPIFIPGAWLWAMLKTGDED